MATYPLPPRSGPHPPYQPEPSDPTRRAAATRARATGLELPEPRAPTSLATTLPTTRSRRCELGRAGITVAGARSRSVPSASEPPRLTGGGFLVDVERHDSTARTTSARAPRPEPGRCRSRARPIPELCRARRSARWRELRCGRGAQSCRPPRLRRGSPPARGRVVQHPQRRNVAHSMLDCLGAHPTDDGRQRPEMRHHSDGEVLVRRPRASRR